MEVILPIVMLVIVAIAGRVLAGGMDEDRVRDYVEKGGGRLLSCDWAPFGKGWFGNKDERIYEVRYLDSGGNEHQAYCKTKMFTGVYFTEDRIVRSLELPPKESRGDARVAELERENLRLREALRRNNNGNG